MKARPRSVISNEVLLASWNQMNSNTNFVVAKDGSGTHSTINEAASAMSKMGKNRPERFIVHVKAGVYNENVEIGRDLKNVMLVGDGIDKTIITGSKNVPDGSTTYSSATFGTHSIIFVSNRGILNSTFLRDFSY